MKTINVFLFSAMLLAGLMYSCQKDTEFNSSFDAAKMITNTNLTKAKVGFKPQKKVNLGVADEFAILSKSGITNVYASNITGNVGSSPITGAAILVTCTEVSGTIFSVDAAGPLPCRVTNATKLGIAVLNMQAAYSDLAGRSNPDFLNLGAGNIGGQTLTPGLYSWTSAVIIPTDITISGTQNDIWVFQVAGTLDMRSAVNVTLQGGAQAKNIFWQTAGAVTLGTTSHFEGNILSQTGINMQTGGSINGRLLAQTAVTLQMNTVVKP